MKPRPVPPCGPSTTQMSRSHALESSNIAQMPWVARLSLCLVLVLTVARPSCLVTATPEFPEPRRTGPLVRILSPEPNLLIRLNKTAGQEGSYPPVLVNFEVFSEDLQTDLLSYFLLDGEAVQWNGVAIAAGSLRCGSPEGVLSEGRAHAATYRIPPGLKPGCHVLQLVVERVSSNSESTDKPAKATWWLDIDDPKGTALLADCPGANVTFGASGDAGVGGGN